MTEPKPESRSAQVLYFVEVMLGLCDLRQLDRAVLRLVYWGGYTQEQAASALGLPTQTVRAAAARGMRELATRLCDGGRGYDCASMWASAVRV